MEFYTVPNRVFLLVIAVCYLLPTSNCLNGRTPIQDSEDLAKCGRRRPNFKRIISGSNAGYWPWHAQIRLPNENRTLEFEFSGVLINKHWVLTSAHTLEETLSPDNIQVALGKRMLKEPEPTERIYNVSEVRIHYNYSLGETISVNDVALLKLSEKVNYTQEIRPACLPKANEREKVGTKCTLTGLGSAQILYTDKDLKNPDILQKVELPVVDFTRCNRTSGYPGYEYHIDNATQFCAGYGRDSNKSACQGDSGGPFSCEETDKSGTKYVVRGILFGGQNYNCNVVEKDEFNIMTRVSMFIEWIEEQINSPARLYPKCVDNHWGCCVFAKRYMCIADETFYGYYMRYKYCPITCRNPEC